jgi:hypothetical protein
LDALVGERGSGDHAQRDDEQRAHRRSLTEDQLFGPRSRVAVAT